MSAINKVESFTSVNSSKLSVGIAIMFLTGLQDVYLFSRRTKALCLMREGSLDKALEQLDSMFRFKIWSDKWLTCAVIISNTSPEDTVNSAHMLNFIGMRNKNLSHLRILRKLRLISLFFHEENILKRGFYGAIPCIYQGNDMTKHYMT